MNIKAKASNETVGFMIQNNLTPIVSWCKYKDLSQSAIVFLNYKNKR